MRTGARHRRGAGRGAQARRRRRRLGNPAWLSNTEAIGALLYGRYLFLFEAAGIVLLVAMIGAIVLTHRQRSDNRGQNVSRQNQRRPSDAKRNTNPGVGEGVQL